MRPKTGTARKRIISRFKVFQGLPLYTSPSQLSAFQYIGQQMCPENVWNRQPEVFAIHGWTARLKEGEWDALISQI
jgi:hypothetical protein